MTTSLGKVQLDKDGHAEVDDEMFDLLISIPENAEHQAKLDALKEPAQKPENKPDELTEEDLKLLEPKELRAIAKQRKITFTKDTTPEQLIASIMATPPPPPELP